MKYILAEACQNTFILFDCIKTKNIDPERVRYAHLCLKNEQRDDAIILTDGNYIDNALYVKMLVVGLDGRLGEFCGNGSVACAAYLFNKYPTVEKFFIKTAFGTHPLNRLNNGIYSIKLPPAKFEINPKFIKDAGLFKRKFGAYTYVEMIEPHIAIEEKISDEELFYIGREINERKDIFPLGINVNAWRVLYDDLLNVKTYERGVQRMTQSCGTGSMSCSSLYKTNGSILVTTPGGTLNIDLDDQGVVLKGPAAFYNCNTHNKTKCKHFMEKCI